MGALSGIFLVFQLITGLLLAMFYTAHVDVSFFSIGNIMTNINYG